VWDRARRPGGRSHFGVVRDALDREAVGQRRDLIAIEVQRHAVDRRMLAVDSFALSEQLLPKPVEIASLRPDDHASLGATVLAKLLLQGLVELLGVGGLGSAALGEDRRGHRENEKKRKKYDGHAAPGG
jgi:hypothetical protein